MQDDKATIAKLIEALNTPPEGKDSIFCRGRDFSLASMTQEEEVRFRGALTQTPVLVVSFLLGSKERFNNLFGNGNCIAFYRSPTGHQMVFIPRRLFEMRFYKHGKASPNTLVL